MDTEFIFNNIKLILSDNILVCGLFISFITASCLMWLLGFCVGIFIAVLYVSGFYLFYLMTKYTSELNSLFSAATRAFLKHFYPCDGNKFIILEVQENHTKLLVSLKIDSALDKLLSRILDEYVSSWYSAISSDLNFQYELRLSLQHAICQVVNRVLQVDVNTIITKKFIPIYLKHIEECNRARKTNQRLNLHPAVYNRQTEMLYLENVSKNVLSNVLPSSDTDCILYRLLITEILARWVFLPMSDVICNPLILNSLLLRYLDGKFSDSSIENNYNDDYVELLHCFVEKYNSSASNLYPDLNQILNDIYLFDAFMNYMKRNGSTHLLQFCLDIDKFNEQLLKPDLTAEELDFLYKDAWDLYCIYFSFNSPNCIQFKSDLAPALRKVLSKDVTKLRTSTTLYEAYEHVYSLIEKHYCPEFYNSNEFFDWLYCYNDLLMNNKSDTGTPNLGSSPVKSSFGKKTIQEISNKLNKIKDALKNNSIMEGQTFDTDCKSADALMEEYFNNENEDDVDDDNEDVSLTIMEERNMNKWKASIRNVTLRTDPVTNKQYAVFLIHVQDEDQDESWMIERKLADFYSLDSKLIEFHGNFPDVHLPPKPRLIKEQIDNVQFHENYLKKLLKNPSLKHSELLYSFLKSTNEFEEDSSLGRLFRKSVVPNSFKRAKSQYLEPFIQSFVSANEKKSKSSKHNSRDSVMSRDLSISSLQDSIYGNNFNEPLDVFSTDVASVIDQLSLTELGSDVFYSPSKYLLYFYMKLYSISNIAFRLLVTLQFVLGTVADIAVRHFVSLFLRYVVTPVNISQIIDLIHWSIFENRTVLCHEEIDAALSKALAKTSNTLCHSVYVKLRDSWQEPKLNKQLYYQLMDALVEELFSKQKLSS